MADCKKMYFKLFNKITDVITELQQIQQEAEDLYIQEPECDLRAIKPRNKGSAEK